MKKENEELGNKLAENENVIKMQEETIKSLETKLTSISEDGSIKVQEGATPKSSHGSM